MVKTCMYTTNGILKVASCVLIASYVENTPIANFMYVELEMKFTAQRFYADEGSLVKLYLRLSENGTASKQFNFTVTPSEQSPLSAEGQ